MRPLATPQADYAQRRVMSATGSCLASVIVPTWNGARLLEPCLTALEAQTYEPLEVLVVDDGSTDETPELVTRAFPRARLIRLPANRRFAGAANVGLRSARGEVLLLLNNDAVAEATWVERSVSALEIAPDVGSVASKILYADGRTINSAGDGFSRAGIAFQHGSGQPDGPRWSEAGEVFGASGAAAAYRRQMLKEVGLFDEALVMYLEDVDLAFRARLRGWRCWFEPSARVAHVGGASAGGPLASYYNGRNTIRVFVKNVPRSLLPELLPGFVRSQARRASEALRNWRGAEARATLRGQAAGLAALADHLAARVRVQAGRTAIDARIRAALSGAA